MYLLDLVDVLVASRLVDHFFFNAPATTEIYTLSLHDALPISSRPPERSEVAGRLLRTGRGYRGRRPPRRGERSEEHTSELQSRPHLVCRLLLEKKKRPMTTLTLTDMSNT